MKDLSPRTFTAELWPGIAGKNWTFLTVPFSVAEAWGVKGRMPVRVFLNGSAPFRTSLSPSGDGTHTLMVNGEMRAAAGGVASGDTITVTLEPDTEPRTVDAPEELRDALAAEETAAATWERLAFSHQKEYVRWITEAKRPETRTKRIAEAVEMLREGRHRNR